MNSRFVRILLASVPALVMLSVPFSADAAPNPRHSLAIPEKGIRIQMIRNTVPKLPHSNLIHVEGKPFCSASVLWSQSQQLAVWESDEVRVYLAEVKFSPSVIGKPEELLPPDGASNWQPYDGIPDDDELRRWVKMYLKCVDNLSLNVSEFSKLIGGGDFSWRRLIQTEKPKIFLYAGSKKNMAVPQMLFLYVVWSDSAKISPREMKALSDKCALSAGLIRVSSASKKGPAQGPDYASDPYYAERLARAKAAVSGLRGWYVMESPHYIFLSDRRNRHSIQRIQEGLEKAREVFRRYFPPEPEDERRCIGMVRVFERREDYLDFTGKKKFSVGVWMTARLELAVSPPDVKAGLKSLEKHLQEVTLHEGFHQYIYYVAGEENPAPWFNEGTAEFFEQSNPRHNDFAALDKDVENLLADAANGADDDLAHFLSIDYGDFTEESQIRRNYALAHALMYYLLRGAPANGEDDYAAIPGRYIEELRKTHDLRKAQEKAFEGIDTRELSKRLKDFWKSRKKVRKARQQKTP